MSTGGSAAPTSPYRYSSGFDEQGFELTIQVTFDASRVMTGATVHRDPGCKFRNIYVGVGADGVPDDTPTVLGPVPDGDTSFGKGQLGAVFGTNATIDTFLARQITAGP